MALHSWLRNLQSTCGLGPGSRTRRRPLRNKPAPGRSLALESLEDRCTPSTFLVVNTLDSGAGSFRAALTQVNADTQPGIDTIDFAIGSGPQTIAPLTPLGIGHPAVIDGTSQPGFAGTPLITISGANLPTANSRVGMLQITSSNCTVEGLNLTLYSRASGVAAAVSISGSSNILGGTTPGAGNVISKNQGYGVYVGPYSTGNVIEGNIIGAPSAPSGNRGQGNLNGICIDSLCTSNTIGGTTAGARNIISGNAYTGVLLSGFGNLVEGNYIGTNVTGTLVPGNQGTGVGDDGSNTIGGTAPGAGNLISGNNSDLNVSSNSVVQGNYIGTDVTGTKVLSNYRSDLSIGGNGNLIGGTTAAARNVLANGPNILGTGNVLQGNYIGTDVTGKVSLLAGLEFGFPCNNGDNTIGGTTPAAGNLNGTLSVTPVLTSAVSANGVITIGGTLSYNPSSTYTLNFFGDAGGTLPIGSSTVTTDATGKAAFMATFAGMLSAAQTVTATAVDAYYNTTLLSAGLTYGPALVVAGIPATTTAGANAFTIAVRNIDGSILTSYTGTVHFSSSDPQAVLPTDYTFTAADQGSHTFSATLASVGLQFLLVTDTVIPGVVGGASCVVTPAAAASLSLSDPYTATAGSGFSITITALDAYGNVATGYTGAIHFSSSDPQAVLPADYTFTAADEGVHTFSTTLETSGIQSITAADTATGSIVGNDGPITVYAAAASKLIVSALPSPSTAGVAGALTVTAEDPYGNVAAGYAGTVHFTSSDAKAVLPANYSFNYYDGGQHTFLVTLKTAGTQSVTATDTTTGSITGTQAGITVASALLPAKSLTVTGFPSPTTAGVAGAITVTARDANGNVAPGYRGTLHFTSSDPKAVLPADYTFTAADQGVHTFTVTLETAGSRSLTATDTATGSIAGSQAGIVVKPAAASELILSAPASVTHGVAFSLTLTVADAYGNVVTGYVGTLHFSSSDSTATLPANYTFTAGDAGVHTFVNKTTLRTKGTQTITVTDTKTVR